MRFDVRPIAILVALTACNEPSPAPASGAAPSSPVAMSSDIATASASLLMDRVTLVGPVEKSAIPGWLDAADILLNTPDTDNTPVSVIEAMASGLCVVSTDVGGLPYLLTHERDALLVAPRDPRAMATAVSRLLGNPGLAARLSRVARAKAESLDWPPIAARWDSLLRRSAARPLQ